MKKVCAKQPQAVLTAWCLDHWYLPGVVPCPLLALPGTKKLLLYVQSNLRTIPSVDHSHAISAANKKSSKQSKASIALLCYAVRKKHAIACGTAQEACTVHGCTGHQLLPLGTPPKVKVSIAFAPFLKPLPLVAYQGQHVQEVCTTNLLLLTLH